MSTTGSNKKAAEDNNCPGDSKRLVVKEQAQAEAQANFADDERIILSEEAFDDFVAVIAAPACQPSEKLLAAVADYKKHEKVLEPIR